MADSLSPDPDERSDGAASKLSFGSEPPATLDRAILESAREHPDFTAVWEEGSDVHYKELVAAGARVASALGRRGLQAGDRVVLISPRGIDGLSAALGILLAGCVYVPVSPEYPAARIRFIVEDCGGSVVITPGVLRGASPAPDRTVALEDLLDPTGDEELGLPGGETGLAPPDPSRLAYILYTSGSTGQPKGVAVPHSAVLNTFGWMVSAFRLRPGEAIPQKTPWGFTDSLWELFLPLTFGGTVSFVSEETVRNPVALYRELRRSGAVITQFVPPALSTFLDGVTAAVPSPAMPRLRWILNGGEELPRALVDRWFSVFPTVGYANSYGMTESAIYASCFFMTRPPVWGMRRVPVGRPITGAEIAVIGGDGQLLGPDAVGEICVGGKSLMTGYWGQPELTRRAFALHPTTGAKLYRTGDYGSLRYDGEIAYLGRRDHQVKIRGMRVELGEVERALLQHSCIRQAAVVPRGDAEGRSLVAFYTVHSMDPGEAAIIDHLAGILPRHMLPVRCVMLDVMPVTSHAKTDRERLLSTAVPGRLRRPSRKASPGSIEEAISRVWAEVLGNDDFGLDDGFFTVGGNSLLLVRVWANLPVELRDVLSIPDLLHHPTIEELSARVEEVQSGSLSASGPVDRSETRRRDPAALGRQRRREGSEK